MVMSFVGRNHNNESESMCAAYLDEKIKGQWNSLAEMPEEFVGSTPLGGGGFIESWYRYYFEFRHFKRIISLNSEMNVLELGCGNGRWIANIAPLVRHYTAVDFSRDGLQIAERMIREKRLSNVRLVEQSVVDYLGDRPYDVVYFSGVTQYLQDVQVQAVLANLTSCMHAHTVIIDRSTVNYSKRWVHDTDDYYCIYRTPEELVALFSQNGWRNTYNAHTYRYLRGGEKMSRGLSGKWVQSIIRRTRPISLYLLLFMTWVLDQLRPPFIKGYHDFFVFMRN